MNTLLGKSNTKEIEILEFGMSNNRYGIDVTKVKEILPYKTPTPIPNSHPFIEGIYMPRGSMLTVISLANALNISLLRSESGMYIVSNINGDDIAFHVEEVFGINRVPESSIMEPEESLKNNGTCSASGITRVNDDLVVILNFDEFMSKING